MNPWASILLLASAHLFALSGRAEDAKPTEVTVRARPRKRDPGRATVNANDARNVAGTRDDALRIVESLPGVARGGFFGGGGIVLWGAAPADSRILVDGVEVPALYHEGGLRGVLPSGLVQSVDLLPGSFGADYGRALGGLVRVTTRDLPREGFHATLGADFLDAAAQVSVAVEDRVRIAVAGRTSHFDKLAVSVAPPEALDVLPIPQYHDFQLKSSLALREGEELSAVLLGAGDSLTRTQPSSDPGKVRRESNDNSFYRYYLRYTRSFDDGTSITVTPFWGHDRSRRDASFGANPQIRDARTFRYGLRASYRVTISRDANVTLGMDALGSRAALFRQGSLTLPPREGDLYVFGQAPGSDVNADAWSSNIIDVAPLVVGEFRFGPALIMPGLRADVFLLEGSRKTPRIGQTPGIGFSRFLPALDPRLSINVFPTDRLSFALSGGLYHQPPSPEDLGPVFGSPDLGLSRAIHASAGGQARLPAGFDIEMTGFYVHQDKLVVRNRSSAPKLAQALTQEGEGQNYGIQLLARRQLKTGFHGWIAYTASRSERRYAGDESFRLFDRDQSHVLTATAGYEWRGWTFGVRFRYASGSPRTPVVGSFFDTTAGQFQPIFGSHNGLRLPSFVSLDVRVQKSMKMGRFKSIVYLDLMNVTNQENAEEIVYNYDFSKQTFLTGLPALAILGARVEL